MIPGLSNLVYLDYHTCIVKPSIPRLSYLDYETKYTSIIIPSMYLDDHALMILTIISAHHIKPMFMQNIILEETTRHKTKSILVCLHQQCGSQRSILSFEYLSNHTSVLLVKINLTQTYDLRNLSYQQAQTRPHCQRKPLGKIS